MVRKEIRYRKCKECGLLKERKEFRYKNGRKCNKCYKLYDRAKQKRLEEKWSKSPDWIKKKKEWIRNYRNKESFKIKNRLYAKKRRERIWQGQIRTKPTPVLEFISRMPAQKRRGSLFERKGVEE